MAINEKSRQLQLLRTASDRIHKVVVAIDPKDIQGREIEEYMVSLINTLSVELSLANGGFLKFVDGRLTVDDEFFKTRQPGTDGLVSDQVLQDIFMARMSIDILRGVSRMVIAVQMRLQQTLTKLKILGEIASFDISKIERDICEAAANHLIHELTNNIMKSSNEAFAE